MNLDGFASGYYVMDRTSGLVTLRRLVAGAGVTFDPSTPGQLVVNASGGGGGGSASFLASVHGNGAANPSWTVPVGVQVDDLALMFHSRDTGTDFVPAAGWSVIGRFTNTAYYGHGMTVAAKVVTSGETAGNTITHTAVSAQRCWSAIYLRDVKGLYFSPHAAARNANWNLDSGGGAVGGLSVALVFGTAQGNTGPIGAFGVDYEVSESYNVSGYTWAHRIGVKGGGIMPRLSGTYGANWDWGSRLITVV